MLRTFSKEQGGCFQVPLHDEESMDHVVFLALGLVDLLRQHVIHCALQQVGHLHVPVPVEHAVQSLAAPAETADRKSCNTQSGRTTEDGVIEESALFFML